MGLDTKESEQDCRCSWNPALSAELSRILESTRQQLEEEFRNRLESAVRDAGSCSDETGRERARAGTDRCQESSFQPNFGVSSTRPFSRPPRGCRRSSKSACGPPRQQWDAEKGRLNAGDECSGAPSRIRNARWPRAALSRKYWAIFSTELKPFAPNLAVYVSKADGLALWKTRGTTAFPELISKETIDPEAYFKPIVVREKTVAAVCARQPLKSESLDFLVRRSCASH